MNVIVGSGYHVNPASLGYNTTTYVGISLEKGSLYNTVVQEFANIPEIVECHYTTGEYAMFIKIYAKSNRDFLRLIHERLQAIKGISSTETIISLNEAFKRQAPIIDIEITDDDYDGDDSVKELE
jgi:Lrp/AsnC family transcriptional regulator for asnA, asnC and gidA